MEWIDSLARRIGEKSIQKRLSLEFDQTESEVGNGCEVSIEIDELQDMRDLLVEKSLEWDRTFDSINDGIVLIDKDRIITKVNDAFYHCIENQVGHVELVGMSWGGFRSISSVVSGGCAVDKCFDTGIHQELDIEMFGKRYHITANPVYSKSGTSKELIGVVRISRDITKQEIEKFKLSRRSGIYHAISEMGKTLVNHENWNDAVNLILGSLGRSIGASRVYIFKNEYYKDKICATRQHSFHSSTRMPCTKNDIMDCVNYDTLPEWQSKMVHGLHAEGTLVECHLCPKKNDCKCTEDVLVMAVPLFVNKRWWGFIGFDYTNGTRKWKDEDSTLLRIAADILGGVIYHRRRYYDSVGHLEECEDHLKEK